MNATEIDCGKGGPDSNAGESSESGVALMADGTDGGDGLAAGWPETLGL